ncbi:uncharacterized protein LOC106055721 [Biomphalaria glabrata]|uniref:Uncharacterized protein LOC106055721 n=1 Tax=Biomphalaria glabrata TaxID=6526 RepID=A0A9W2YZJ5_BIOGL|nr:uncharacterized protein LOC106055721 [Biomphalaria glabrata]
MAVIGFNLLYMCIGISLFLTWLLANYISFIWVLVAFVLLCLLVNYKKIEIDEEMESERIKVTTQEETEYWANYLIGRCWVVFSANIEEAARSIANRRLRDMTFSFAENLEITSVSLGKQTPVLSNVRVTDNLQSPSHSVFATVFQSFRPPHQVTVKATLTLDSTDMDIESHGLFKTPINAFDASAIIKGLTLHGNVEIILSRESRDVPFPHFSKAKVCFAEVPKLHTNVYILKFVNIMRIPFLQDHILQSLKSGLEQVISPKCIDIQLDRCWGSSDTKC